MGSLITSHAIAATLRGFDEGSSFGPCSLNRRVASCEDSPKICPAASNSSSESSRVVTFAASGRIGVEGKDAHITSRVLAFCRAESSSISTWSSVLMRELTVNRFSSSSLWPSVNLEIHQTLALWLIRYEDAGCPTKTPRQFVMRSSSSTLRCDVKPCRSICALPLSPHPSVNRFWGSDHGVFAATGEPIHTPTKG